MMFPKKSTQIGIFEDLTQKINFFQHSNFDMCIENPKKEQFQPENLDENIGIAIYTALENYNTKQL